MDFKGFKLVKGFDENGNKKDIDFEEGYLYFVREKEESKEDGHIHINGKDYGQVNGVNCGEYEPSED